ncbi:flavin reductase family protein [Phanerochaete sordida]|uniref:Flavin reductase family protein n=1 Tax=Phanerochaete sordida TaxID=48140 RepID=A0A9P3GG77_9APHY|nr:flavin reductase family protein [Phanerochaete sordida]
MSLPSYPADHSSQYFESPNPSFTYGTPADSTPAGKAWVEGEKEGWTVVDTATEDPGKLYRLMISGIIPRPIAFVSSVSEAGVENLAPFSWFNMVSHYPPLVSISITNIGSSFKDTAANIRATKEFVVNIISEPFVEQANVTCIDTPSNVSEWELSGLTRAPSVHVKPARVKESAFSMECELYQAIDIIHPDTGAKTNTFVLGLVKKIHVRNDVLLDRHSEANPGDVVKLVDPTKFKPVARMGDITYASCGPLYRIGRPVYASEKEKIGEFLAAAEKAKPGEL